MCMEMITALQTLEIMTILSMMGVGMARLSLPVNCFGILLTNLQPRSRFPFYATTQTQTG